MQLLLVDDHPLFAYGFAQALAGAGHGAQVQTAATIADGLELAAAAPDLDIVLIDHRLAGEDGLDGLRRFGAAHPLVARVLISGLEDPGLAEQARRSGASGFIGKSMPLDTMLAALHEIRRGGTFFHAGAASPSPPSSAWPTARQMEVLALIAQGQPNKRISQALGIAERTVKLHITGLMGLLGARNRTHLVARARERGLL
jgi:DNA-binding NarL/FixJ family response regulator